MKMNIKNIILVILIVAIGILIGYTIYYFTNDDNEINNGQIDNDNLENETISFTDEELEKYLSYIPSYSESTIDTINKSSLLHRTLAYAYDNDYFVSTAFNDIDENYEIYIYSYAGRNYLDYVDDSAMDKLIYSMFNLSLDDFDVEESGETIAIIDEYQGMCFFHYDGGFVVYGCSETQENVSHIIVSYEATNDELIIYTYSVEFAINAYGDLVTGDIFDHNGNDITFENGECGLYYNDCEEILEEYFNTHQEEFTNFKYTFKKNDAGYYWYQTEIVK